MVGMLIDEETGDLMVESSNLKLGDLRAQVAELVLTASPGEFKEVPMIGGDVASMFNGTKDPFWPGKMKTQLNAMGVDVERIAISDDGIDLTVKE